MLEGRLALSDLDSLDSVSPEADRAGICGEAAQCVHLDRLVAVPTREGELGPRIVGVLSEAKRHPYPELRSVFEEIDAPVFEPDQEASPDMDRVGGILSSSSKSLSLIAQTMRDFGHGFHMSAREQFVRLAIQRADRRDPSLLNRKNGKVFVAELDKLLNDFATPFPFEVDSFTVGARDALLSAIFELDDHADLVTSERMVADILREPRRIVREALGKLQRQVGMRRLRVGILLSSGISRVSNSSTTPSESPDGVALAVMDPALRRFVGFAEVSRASWKGDPAWVLLDRKLGTDDREVEQIVEAAKKLAARVGVQHLLIPVNASLHETNALARLAWKLDIPAVAAAGLVLGEERLDAVWAMTSSPAPNEDMAGPALRILDGWNDAFSKHIYQSSARGVGAEATVVTCKEDEIKQRAFGEDWDLIVVQGNSRLVEELEQCTPTPVLHLTSHVLSATCDESSAKLEEQLPVDMTRFKRIVAWLLQERAAQRIPDPEFDVLGFDRVEAHAVLGAHAPLPRSRVIELLRGLPLTPKARSLLCTMSATSASLLANLPWGVEQLAGVGIGRTSAIDLLADALLAAGTGESSSSRPDPVRVMTSLVGAAQAIAAVDSSETADALRAVLTGTGTPHLAFDTLGAIVGAGVPRAIAIELTRIAQAGSEREDVLTALSRAGVSCGRDHDWVALVREMLTERRGKDAIRALDLIDVLARASAGVGEARDLLEPTHQGRWVARLPLLRALAETGHLVPGDATILSRQRGEMDRIGHTFFCRIINRPYATKEERERIRSVLLQGEPNVLADLVEELGYQYPKWDSSILGGRS